MNTTTDINTPTPLLLQGKVAAITGAARGIGLATAQCFAQAGARVVLMGRSLPALEQACAHIQNAQPGAPVQPLVCDVSQPDSVRQAFQDLWRQHKQLHLLVANAGVMQDALIGMVTPQQIEQSFATNTFGTLYCAQYASRLMARSGGGAIITLSSIIGRSGNAGQAVYSGSKAAVIGITQSLAKELAPQGIRVNAIAPGVIDTDLSRAVPPEKMAQHLTHIALGRAGAAQEVAQTALFLASDMASYITGQVIGVDGGMSL